MGFSWDWTTLDRSLEELEAKTAASLSTCDLAMEDARKAVSQYGKLADAYWSDMRQWRAWLFSQLKQCLERSRTELRASRLRFREMRRNVRREWRRGLATFLRLGRDLLRRNRY